MLTKIREKLTGKLAIVVLAIIFVPFLFFGVSAPLTGSQIVATVDGSEIGAQQFEQAYRDQLNANPSWSQLPDEIRVQIRQSILDSLIRERLVNMYLVEDGYQISDTLLTGWLQRVPDFQVDGVFDMETYRNWLLTRGLDPEQFEASQRASLRSDQLRRAIGGTSLITPADYRRFLNLIAEQRLVSLATFDIESAMAEVEVNDEMIVAFYDSNDTLFLTEESADIAFIEVRRDEISGSIEISEDALLEYYEDNQDRYLQDEQRQARHILILSNDDEDAAEAEAAALLARIQAGESFETLAAEHSDDGGTAASGGDLGALTRSQLPGELGGAIFSMDAGEVDGPIKSDFGFHVVRLDAILEQGPLPLEQVRGELLTELRDREAEDAFLELERQVSDALFDAPDLETIAAATGLEVKTAMGFTRAGGEPIGANQAAIDAVFDSRVLYDGEISEVIELDASRSAVFKVTTHYEASRQSLEDVREEIKAALQRQEAQTILFNRAEQLLVALNNGEDFGAAAEAAGAAVSAPTLLGRQDTETDQAVLAQVFMAKKPTLSGPVTGSVTNTLGGITVYSVDAVLAGRPESIPLADRDAGKLELAQQAGSSDYLAFVQALYDKADIVISKDALAEQELFQ
jgi:peptidyl-prolyl cis-trans isomerase D